MPPAMANASSECQHRRVAHLDMPIRLWWTQCNCGAAAYRQRRVVTPDHNLQLVLRPYGAVNFGKCGKFNPLRGVKVDVNATLKRL